MLNLITAHRASSWLTVLLLGLAASPAVARASGPVSRIVTVEPAPPTDAAVGRAKGAWTAGSTADCTRSRRKLWQEGEGWIVKTITTCR